MPLDHALHASNQLLSAHVFARPVWDLKNYVLALPDKYNIKLLKLFHTKLVKFAKNPPHIVVAKEDFYVQMLQQLLNKLNKLNNN
jgi:hypothetical protein